MADADVEALNAYYMQAADAEADADADVVAPVAPVLPPPAMPGLPLDPLQLMQQQMALMQQNFDTHLARIAQPRSNAPCLQNIRVRRVSVVALSVQLSWILLYAPSYSGCSSCHCRISFFNARTPTSFLSLSRTFDSGSVWCFLSHFAISARS